MTKFSRLITERPIADVHAYVGNARVHSAEQIRQIAASIDRFGFTNPVLVSETGEIIAGHGRVEAARFLGLMSVPTICLSHLNDEERRAYVLADNKLALNAGWDEQLLACELEALLDFDFDVELTGFSTAEIDLALHFALDGETIPEEAPPPRPGVEKTVTRAGDIWQLGNHRLICGDARDPATFEALLEDEKADLILTDPPYNLSSERRGKAKVQHRTFTMAAGEMSEDGFTEFLATTLGNCAAHGRDGAIAFVFMDWRHMGEVLTAGKRAFSELKNLCVWNKATAGLGKFYRSKHELVFVFKIGTAAHVNNFGMGGKGRYRTNVWDYAGVNGFREGRDDDLALHPTVKPVTMLADAIIDCSNRGDLVLDAFAGTGTTLLASEKVGRRARLIEIDSEYCDVVVQRYQEFTGRAAVHRQSQLTFDDLRKSLPTLHGSRLA